MNMRCATTAAWRKHQAALKLPGPAARYLGKALPCFLQNDCAPSEPAFAHAIAANVASAEGNAEPHATHYAQAQAAGARIDRPEERRLFEATLRVIPAPSA